MAESTLITTGVFDSMLHRLRERAADCGCEIGDGYCEACDARLTEADLEQGACTQCLASISTDESADEDLWGEPDDEFDELMGT